MLILGIIFAIYIIKRKVNMLKEKIKIKAKFYVKVKISSENSEEYLENFAFVNDYSFDYTILDFIKKINNNLNFRWLLEGEAI